MLLEFYGKSFSPAKKIGNILFPDDVTTEDVVLNMPLLSSTTLKPVMDAKLSQKCGFDPAENGFVKTIPTTPQCEF